MLKWTGFILITVKYGLNYTTATQHNSKMEDPYDYTVQPARLWQNADALATTGFYPIMLHVLLYEIYLRPSELQYQVRLNLTNINLHIHFFKNCNVSNN